MPDKTIAWSSSGRYVEGQINKKFFRVHSTLAPDHKTAELIINDLLSKWSDTDFHPQQTDVELNLNDKPVYVNTAVQNPDGLQIIIDPR